MEFSDSSNTIKYILAILVIAIVFLLTPRLLTGPEDYYEPPYIRPKIPVIGHIVSLIREGADYYMRLDKERHLGIYTLPIFRARMYMVASPEWAAAVHRAHKTLYFNTLIAQAMQNLFCMDDAAMKLINENLNGENGKREGIMLEVHDMMQSVLAPGPQLDDLNKGILDNITPTVNQLARGETSRVKLWLWLRQHFATASVAAIWGPRNPFTINPDVEPAFWEFEANAMPLTMMPMPHLIARKGYKAREKVFSAFQEYMENEYYDDPETSNLIKNRAKISMGKFNLSKKMHACADASLLFGALLNTIPTAFWLISWIFEDPQLLVGIRQEVDKCIATISPTSKERKIDITKLRANCPIFSSAFRETLRMTGGVNSNRFVAEDTIVTNNSTGEGCLLKKGSVVQIASNVIHFKSFWGSDSSSFNPRRFMGTGEKARNEAGANKPQDPAAPFRDANGKILSSAFRSFGGGNNICPGRYFAQTEVMALASLFIAGFEIEGTSGDGKYRMPPFEDYKLMMGVIKPGKDVEVDISRRKGYEDVLWTFAGDSE